MRKDEWKPRFCCVNKGKLFMYKNPQAREASKALTLQGANVRKMDSFPGKTAFQLVIASSGAASKQAIILATEDDDLAIWMNLIDQVC